MGRAAPGGGDEGRLEGALGLAARGGLALEALATLCAARVRRERRDGGPVGDGVGLVVEGGLEAVLGVAGGPELLHLRVGLGLVLGELGGPQDDAALRRRRRVDGVAVFVFIVVAKIVVLWV